MEQGAIKNMKAAFHYIVKIKIIRYNSKDEIDFFNYEKKFEHENPIRAREAAFKEYEEWINDLYIGLGKQGQYTTDRQARIDLKTFIIPTENQNIQINDTEIDFGNSLGYGIGVYFVIDKPYHPVWETESMHDKAGEEHLLHGIGTIDIYDDPLEVSDQLNIEILYYEHYNYYKGNHERKTNFYDWDIDDVDEIHYLETPFDWSGLDVKPEKLIGATIEQNTIQIEKIIAEGEGNRIEFKPSLLYNFKTKQAGIGVKAKIATAICAFLNSNGGFLFIGLDDTGEPQGLEWDFSLANGKQPKDYFHGEFDQMLSYFLSFTVKQYIIGQFIQLNGKDIFIVAVEPSKNRPIFLKGQNGKEFWVRGNHGNRQLTDNEELANYCIDKWGK
jgi:hypothetical protein